MAKKLQSLGELIIEGLYAAISYEKGETEARTVTVDRDTLERKEHFGFKQGLDQDADTGDTTAVIATDS